MSPRPRKSRARPDVSTSDLSPDNAWKHDGALEAKLLVLSAIHRVLRRLRDRQAASALAAIDTQ